MSYVRELNEGVARIYESMKRSLLADPEYTDKNDIVTLTLRNKVSTHKDTISEIAMKKIEANLTALTDIEKQILEFLFKENQADIMRLVSVFEKSEPVIRNGLKKLITLGIVEKNTDKIRDKNALYGIRK